MVKQISRNKLAAYLFKVLWPVIFFYFFVMYLFSWIDKLISAFKAAFPLKDINYYFRLFAIQDFF